MTTSTCAMCGKNGVIVTLGREHFCYDCLDEVHSSVTTHRESIRNNGKKRVAVKEAIKEALPTPKEIYNKLSQVIISQDKMKEDVSIAVARHIRRVHNPRVGAKANVLIFGPTGSGKTEVARQVAEQFKLPIAIVDINMYSPTAYVGNNIQDIALRLVEAADGDIKKAEKGIIVLDEIDKILGDTSDSSISSKMQQQLLKIVEGTELNFKSKNGGADVHIRTNDILFIACGAFIGLKDLVVKRRQKMGLMSDNTEKPEEANWENLVRKDHLKAYGAMPEFLGRFPVITHTNRLRPEDFEKILKESLKSPLKDYTELFKMDGKNLIVSASYILKLSQECMEIGTGARGLYDLIERDFRNLFFNGISDIDGVTLENMPTPVTEAENAEKLVDNVINMVRSASGE